MNKIGAKFEFEKLLFLFWRDRFSTEVIIHVFHKAGQEREKQTNKKTFVSKNIFFKSMTTVTPAE